MPESKHSPIGERSTVFDPRAAAPIKEPAEGGVLFPLATPVQPLLVLGQLRAVGHAEPKSSPRQLGPDPLNPSLRPTNLLSIFPETLCRTPRPAPSSLFPSLNDPQVPPVPTRVPRRPRIPHRPVSQRRLRSGRNRLLASFSRSPAPPPDESRETSPRRAPGSRIGPRR